MTFHAFNDSTIIVTAKDLNTGKTESDTFEFLKVESTLKSENKKVADV